MAIVWMVVIFLLSSIHGENLLPEPSVMGWDKFAHAFIYGILGLFVYKAFPENHRNFWFVWLFCVIYGVSDEVHQLFVPGRYSSVADLAADAIGAGLGYLTAHRIRRT